LFASTGGLMIGRMAAARPWVFAQWHNPELTVDLTEVWNRFCHYLEDDFSPEKALIKLKVFTPYFARNFVFGHTLFAAVQGAANWLEARKKASQFLAGPQPLIRDISLSGL
jgi:tRNA-dihydrouridine synthase